MAEGKIKKIVTVDFDGVIMKKVGGIDWVKQKSSVKPKEGIGFEIIKLINMGWMWLNNWWRKPIDGSLDGLKRLKAEGYKLVMLTSRYGYQRGLTMAWLKKQGFYELYDEFYFNDRNIGAISSKVENMKIIGADCHIDDNRNTVDELRRVFPNLKVILLTSWDKIAII